jgi:formylglycine-generating enzyme required for sulfatase activity
VGDTKREEIARLQDQLRSLETLRLVLGEAVADRTKAELEARLQALIATGGGAAVLGTVQTGGGDVIGRDDRSIGKVRVDKIEVHIRAGQYQGSVPRSAAEREAIYREAVADRCGTLPLRGVEPSAGEGTATREALSLAQVYIALDTTRTASARVIEEALGKAARDEGVGLERGPRGAEPGPAEQDMRAVSALEATILYRHLVLLGHPGSGKSTFISHLTHGLARRDWDQLPGWPKAERTALPIPITLRDFARWLSSRRPRSRKPCAGLPWAFIRQDLKDRRVDFAAKLLERALEDGRAVVMYDGLDEIPPEDEELLAQVRGSVEAFAQHYRNSRHLVTCRVLSYQDPHWRLPEHRFPDFELAPFTEDQIDGFIGAWYAEVGDKWKLPPGEGERLAGKLRQAVRRADLWRLAPNPLLLTVMALVHTHRKELPEKRALLYADAVDILLLHWEKGKRQDAPELQDLLREVERDANDLKDVLEGLAFEAHASSGGTDQESGIDELTLLRSLARLHPKGNYGWAQRLVETLRLRASLLLERKGRVFGFPHRTFQEYLAGVHLARRPNFDEEAVRLAGEGAFWREVILLAVGYLVHQREHGKPRLLVEALCPDRASRDEADWRKAWLAGEVLLEIGVNRAEDTEHGRRLLVRVRERLTQLLETGVLSPRERAEAGDILGQIGDPRFDPALFHLPCRYRGEPEPLAGFVEVPPGAFVMGSRQGDAEAYENELGNPERLIIDYRYWVARYPVTVAQYRAFVEAGAAGAEPPEDWAVQSRFPNRPVVNVSWWHARAYCRWLDQCLRETETGRALLPPGYAVRLPTEAEWEKAARHGDGRRYPWADEDWEEQRANIRESGIRRPTPVGMYPLGATPAGLQDLSGNVWEWTLSRWRGYPYRFGDGRDDPEAERSCVVRGGSWDYPRRYARCAYRRGGPPDDFGSALGFRVVVSLADSGF